MAAQLHNVQQLQATEQAFAALLSDGSVVTWGGHEEGGLYPNLALNPMYALNPLNPRSYNPKS